MASRIFSIRLDDTAVEALERVQSPSDDSLNTTLKRVVLDALGIDVNIPVNIVNSDERLQELVDAKTAYLATAINEIKNSLETEIEALRLKVDSLTTAKTAKTAIATKATSDNPTCPICGTSDKVTKNGRGGWICKNNANHPNKKSNTFS